MAPTVEKKISELEMGLLHLQQNIDIPEINLPIHQVVSTVIKKCAEEGRKPKVEDFGDKVEDAQLLNALQSGVNRWIREIQKVTCVLLKMKYLAIVTLHMMLIVFVYVYKYNEIRTSYSENHHCYRSGFSVSVIGSVFQI